MAEKGKHINYTATDIEKYWKGQLSPAEMHSMEKAALEDSFLADALEGYQTRSSESGVGSPSAITNDINILQERLAERVTEKKLIPLQKFGWWKVAAALVVLVAGVWIYTAINNKSKDSSLAKNELVKKLSPAPKQDSVAMSPNKTDTLQGFLAIEKKQPGIANKKAAVPARITEKETVNDVASNSSSVADSNSVAKHEEIKKSEERAEPKVTSISISKRASKPEADKSVQAQLSGTVKGLSSDNADKTGATGRRAFAMNNDINTFNGKIVDQLNQPVPNATVQIPNLNVATQTDNKGNFSFKAPDTSLSVSIASAGFQTQNLKLQKAQGFSNQITLKPKAPDLLEASAGYGSNKKAVLARKKDVTIKILDAEPVIDWNAYSDYLEKNKKVPEELKDTHGDVVISFIVDNNNQRKSFRIEKSLDEQLDEEAIRLIKEGPSWKLLKGKKARASVTVKF